MPTTKVRAPDGKLVRVRHPEGASEADIIRYAQENYNPSPRKPSELPKLAEAESRTERAVKNIPSSATNVVKNVVTAFTQPLETADAMANLLFGGMDVAAGAVTDSPVYNTERAQMARNAAEMFKQRYGSGLQNTAITDPVGLGVDVLGLASGGLGAASRLPTVGRYAGMAQKAVRSADPFNMLMSGTGKAGSGVRRAVTETVGELTGAGGGAAERAIARNAPSQNRNVLGLRSNAFADGLSGRKSGTEIISDARRMVGEFTDRKRREYLADMDNVKAWTEPLDLAPVRKKVAELTERYGVKPTFRDGQFVGVQRTAKSGLSQEAIGDINRAYQEVLDWSRQKGNNFTPENFDVLKKRLDNLYSENSQARGFIADLRNTVKNQIVDTVPQYENAMAKYAKYSDVENDLLKALSLNKRANIDTALKKLSSTFRKNFEGRNEILETAQGLGLDFDSVMDSLAGMQMQPLLARGLMGKMSVGAGLVGSSGVVSGALPVQVLGTLALTSPKVMAQTLGSFGWTQKQIDRLANNPAFQTLAKGMTTTEGRAITSNMSRYRDLINSEVEERQ